MHNRSDEQLSHNKSDEFETVLKMKLENKLTPEKKVLLQQKLRPKLDQYFLKPPPIKDKVLSVNAHDWLIWYHE